MKRFRFILIMLTALMLSTLTGCKMLAGWFGSSSERFLANHEKTIVKHHTEWLGEGNSDARSVFAGAVKSTEEMLGDNLDYLRDRETSDSIIGVRYFPRGIGDYWEDGFEGLPKTFFEKTDRLVVFRTNKGMCYLGDVRRAVYDRASEWSIETGLYPEEYMDELQSCFNILNQNYRYIEELPYTSMGFNTIAGDDSFVHINLAPLITSEFPYPMYYQFDSTYVHMMYDAETDSYCWGEYYTGHEGEEWPAFQTCSLSGYLNYIDIFSEDGTKNPELADKYIFMPIDEAIESGEFGIININQDPENPIYF